MMCHLTVIYLIAGFVMVVKGKILQELLSLCLVTSAAKLSKADPFILDLDRLYNPLCRKSRSFAYDPDCPCLPAQLLNRRLSS